MATAWLYKLTDQDGYTRRNRSNECKWEPGVKHTASGPRTNPPSKSMLCTSSLIHAYCNPLIAVIMNPRHAAIEQPILWRATGFPVVREGQLKLGCYTLTTHDPIELPVITTAQRVRFAILCSMERSKNSMYKAWAENWLSGADRSSTPAADAAAADADGAANAAASAAYAAYAAAYAADAAAAYAAYAAAYAANAAYAAYAAAYAANAAFNIIKLLTRAIREEQ